MNGPERSEDTIRDGELVNGHTPAYWAARGRSCPQCGAKRHTPCVSPAGKSIGGTLHAARYGTPEGETS